MLLTGFLTEARTSTIVSNREKRNIRYKDSEIDSFKFRYIMKRPSALEETSEGDPNRPPHYCSSKRKREHMTLDLKKILMKTVATLLAMSFKLLKLAKTEKSIHV